MIQTTKHDVVFSGHGAVLPEAGRVTRVPYGVEFYMFGPPGITITDALGQKLEGVLPSRAYSSLRRAQALRHPYSPQLSQRLRGRFRICVCLPRGN